MLINIIKNFIYEKNFKGKTIKDVKNYYNIPVILSGFFVIAFSSLAIFLEFMFGKFKENLFAGIPLFLLLTVSAIATICFTGITAKLVFEKLFCIKRIKRKIDEKSFSLRLVKADKTENFLIKQRENYYRLEWEDFFTEYNYVLRENLTNEDIEKIINDFVKAGLSEEEVKNSLKKRLEYKDKFEINLEDFCFITEDLNPILKEKNNKEKKLKISEIVDNIQVKN